METSVLDLRKKMREIMSAIDRHERVTLTYRGRRRAVIVPLPDRGEAEQGPGCRPARLRHVGGTCRHDRPRRLCRTAPQTTIIILASASKSA